MKSCNVLVGKTAHLAIVLIYTAQVINSWGTFYLAVCVIAPSLGTQGSVYGIEVLIIAAYVYIAAIYERA